MLNLFRKSPKPEAQEKKSLIAPTAETLELFGVIASASGVDVTPSAAMRVPAVAAAVGLIAETTGTLPAKLYDQGKEPVKAHRAYRLIHDEANDWTSASQLREHLTTDALLHGNGYAMVTRFGDGSPAELHRLDPVTVTEKQEQTGEPFYEVTTLHGGTIRYPYTDILHVQAFGGVTPITLGREAIGLAIAFEKHIASLFANGGRPSGIIRSERVLDVEAKRKLAASWFNTHGGNRSGSTAVLDEGLSYQPISTTLADAQFAENRLEQIREIARVFRVPPTMLFELTRGTWSNTEEMARQFYAITLRPWLAAWEWAYARALLTPEERQDLYVEFVTDDLLTTDTAAKATALGQYRSMGAMTGNDVRARLNMPPHPDGNRLDNPHISTPSAQENAA